MPSARTIRWMLLPLAAVGSCGATGVASRGVQGWLEARIGQVTLEAALPLDGQQAIRLALEAFVFVVAGTLVAPRARALIAPALFAVGAGLAWVVLRGWYFPEFHPRGYEMSSLPLWGCWAGGVLAVAVMALPSVRGALASAGADGLPG